MIENINFTLNGKPISLKTDSDRMLLWVLRSDLGLTGTKYGCGEGFCGACTVLIDKKPERSCQFPLKNLKGKEVTTIEGLSLDESLHPLQQAFMEHDALQCGYCTSGMILNALGLLYENPDPTEAEIIAAMEDNLCRCGAHPRIVKAIQTAAESMRGR
jgi:aerobic-type carbon monoxide dehydrogenase small subunit (CoxS/CutS family)